MTAPCGLIEEVLEARHYAAAKAMVDAKDAPKGQRHETPSMRRVQQIEMAIAAEELGLTHE